MKINRVLETAGKIYEIIFGVITVIFGPMILFTIGLGIWDRLR